VALVSPLWKVNALELPVQLIKVRSRPASDCRRSTLPRKFKAVLRGPE
jgi:hypothetical protein